MEKSRLNGRYFSFHGLQLGGLGDEEMDKLQRLGTAVAKNWEWAWTTSIDESIKAALCMLSEL